MAADGKITFTAYGVPQPAGSKNGAPFRRKDGRTGVAMRDSNPKAKPWQAIVANAAREAYSGDLLRGPLSVNMTFFLPRPKGHFGSGKNAAKLRPSAPEYPAKKPDVLKLSRGTEDALTGIVWADDAQIVNEYLTKCYGEPARVVVVIRELK